MPNYPQTPREKSKLPTARIFQRSLVAEFSGIAVAVFVVLLAITLITQLIRFLGHAATGLLASEAVLAMLGFRALNALPVLLSLTLFISVLLALTRSYRDSEMVVWFSSGLSLGAWVRPVLVFAGPVVVTIALLSLLLSPWASERAEEYRRQLDARDEAAQVKPGVFQESRRADRVFFVESMAPDQKRVGNVFVQSTQNQRLGIMVAREGYQGTDEDGDRYLVLVNGTRYEGRPGSAEYRSMRFERYAMRIDAGEAKRDLLPPSSLASADLLRDPTPLNIAELQWRLGLPVTALVLVLLAVPLSFVNPRAGRSINLIMAILVYLVYNNLLSLAKLWVALGKVPVLLAFLGVHGLMLLLLLALFYRRVALVRLAWRRR